jgi:hypothetical protein
VKNHTKTLLGLAAACIMLSACKLDKPVNAPPEDPAGTTDQTVLGITVNGRAINDDYLNGLWKVSKTVRQFYDTSNVVISGKTTSDMFTAVSLNDQTKTLKYLGLPANSVPATGRYELSTSDNVLYIKLTSNPFFNSSKSQVRVTHLTGSAMTWIALDTVLSVTAGQPSRAAYQINFIK